MDITILVSSYLLISALCTCAFVSACIVSGRSNDVRHLVVRAAPPKHHNGVLALSANTAR